MKLSRKWLSEFVDIKADSKEYADRMTMSGSKVEITEEPGAEIKKVVVGEVTETRRHENSDHLWVCTVDVGGEAPVTIVTGAQNVNAGDMVPVALHRSRLPGGVEIKKGKLRGVKSEGMLCSLSELELDLHDFPNASEDGIFILEDEGLVPGEDIRPVIGKDDSVVEFEITNNRPDCFSVIGLARESAVTFDVPLRLTEPRVQGSGGSISDYLDIEIQNPGLCPRYTGRVIKSIKIEPSPKWMRQRLRASGVRPINNIVDITNYVMLEYGQPMHAFDYSLISGNKIIVRSARDGETLNTLDGACRKLTSDMLVIADESKAVGIAGVMGGENSEITGDTKMVVFESANFDGVNIRKTASALGLRTDASSRYEKGLDTQSTLPAVQRACELVELLGAGEVVDGIVDVIASDKNPVTLTLEPGEINRLLGTEISESFMRDTLEKLGFTLEGDVITVPSWRPDILHYSDIAEEVARFYGYNVIEPTMFKGETPLGGLTERQQAERAVGSLMRGLGYSEILTYSFISPGAYDKIRMPENSPLRKSATIINPLGEDTSIMRTMALPSMLETLSRNYVYRNENARLYEMATVYLPGGSELLCDERIHLALGGYGGDLDFLRIKGCVEAVIGSLRITGAEFYTREDDFSYHPGRCAQIKIGGVTVGVLGQIHPLAAKSYGIDCDVYCAELDFYSLYELRTTGQKYAPLPKFPAVSRDIALVCGEEVPAAELARCIKRAGGELLRETKLFDVYTGDPIPQGKKSMAYSLSFRADDRTLTDAGAEEAMDRIIKAINDEFGAVIR